MTFNFDLPPAIEQSSLMDAATGSIPARSTEDFMARLQEVINLHPAVTTFVDDSRESIYAGRGE